MISNELCWTFKKGERIHRFYCAPDTPVGEIYDVASEIAGYALEKMKEASKPKESNDNQQ